MRVRRGTEGWRSGERDQNRRRRAARAAGRLLAGQGFSRLAILALMFAVSAVLQQNFFEPKAIVRNINAFIPLVLMTMGQAVVIISGGIDLSAGTALSLLTCVLTSVMRKGDPVTGVYALAGRLRRRPG